MKLVGSGLGDDRDHSGGELAVLRAEGAGLDSKLLYGVGVRRRVAVVAHTGDVVAAIEVESHLRAAAVDGAVDLDIFDVQSGRGGGSAGGVRGGAVVIGHHAGREGDLGVDIAVDQRQTDKLIALDGPAQYRVRRIDLRGGCLDGDGIGRSAQGQRDIQGQHLVHVQSEVLLHKAFKAGGLCRDRVPSYGKVIDAVLPIAIGLS